MKIDQSGQNESLTQAKQMAAEYPYALYRGFSGPHYGINHPFSNPYFENPREPRYQPSDRQNEIGKWFLNHFKIDYWNASLFATGSFSVAKAYAGEFGSVGIIEPADISQGTICWSPVYASFAEVLESRPDTPVAELLDNGKYQVFSWQNEATLREAALSSHELMVISPSFKVSKWINP